MPPTVSHTGEVATRRRGGAHASGEFVVGDGFLRDFEERRRQGTRLALDWKYSSRLYAFVPLVLMIGLVGGVDLLGKVTWWQRVTGALLLLATAVCVGVLVRWLRRPVDAASKEQLRKYYDDMRLRNIWRDIRGSAKTQGVIRRSDLPDPPSPSG